MDWQFFYMMVGFFLASYAVLGNDTIQTLGTFISSSNKDHWVWHWLGASTILVGVLVYGWVAHGGDISFGRLDKIPIPAKLEWYHAAVPLVLVILTRFGLPVSTTFLVLSVFATSTVIQEMVAKSVMGYAVAAVVAYGFWFVLSRIIDEHNDVPKSHKKWWRVAQTISTGLLWSQWLMHDLANIAVYLPRKKEFTLPYLVLACVVLTGGLGMIFWMRGGKIQEVIVAKSGTRFVRSATIIDLIYAFVLFFFKEYNSIPMSTTWVFVGLLCGRELAVYRLHNPKKHIRSVFPVLAQDFFKVLIGLAVSVAVALAVQGMPTDDEPEDNAPEASASEDDAPTDPALEVSSPDDPAPEAPVLEDPQSGSVGVLKVANTDSFPRGPDALCGKIQSLSFGNRERKNAMISSRARSSSGSRALFPPGAQRSHGLPVIISVMAGSPIART
ncbi:MAG: inorganic phosphate transporter [Planctomycetales bacterium]